MKKAILIPNKSVGDINLGDFITNYLNRQYAYHPKGDLYLEDLYTFDIPRVDVFVDEDKKITTINCSVECFWKDVDLIKMQFSQFLAMANIQPDSEEKSTFW